VEELVIPSDRPEELYQFFMQCLEHEETRKELARSGQLDRLQTMYGDTVLHLPAMNSSFKWDFYSYRDFDSIDRVTVARIDAVIEEVPDNARVLDYGCGYGYVLARALQKKKKWNYTGIDFSEKFINKLHAKFPGADFFVRDIRDIEEHQFDVVLLLEVLEHISSGLTMDFLATVKNILTYQGKLILSVPLFEKIAESTCPCWSCGELGNPNGHVRSYTPDLIRSELQLAGFSIEKSTSIFAKNRLVVVWKNAIKHLLGMEKTQPCNLVVVAR